jgi:hypothetical protein
MCEGATLLTHLVDPGMIETKDVAIVLCGMWSIWMLRNKRRLGKGVPIRVAVRGGQ